MTSPTEFAEDFSNVKFRKGEDDSLHFEELLGQQMSKEMEWGGHTKWINEWVCSSPHVMLDLFCMKAATEKNILNSSIGKKFERVFNQGGVCERKETLFMGKEMRLDLRLMSCWKVPTLGR